MKTIFTFFIFIIILGHCHATSWTTISNGFWNDNTIWQGGIVPPYSSSDTFLIKHPVVIENNLFFSSGSLVKIDSLGGLCGHHNISVNTNAKIIKYGILELDSLKIPGGEVICRATGEVILTLYAIISNGGSLSVSGCSFSVGPWFTCVEPEYAFAIGISEKMITNNIKIFPNPGNGLFEIAGEHFPKESQLIIIDLLGRTLYNKRLISQVEKVSINLSDLENGIYSWVLISENKIATRGKIEIVK